VHLPWLSSWRIGGLLFYHESVLSPTMIGNCQSVHIVPLAWEMSAILCVVSGLIESAHKLEESARLSINSVWKSIYFTIFMGKTPSILQ
jgi:hypothetical protein